MSKKKINTKKLFHKQLSDVPKETELFVKKLMNFSNQLCKVMKEKDIDEKTLINKTGLKKEELVSILKGNKDLTMEEITKLEAALDVELIVINHLF